MRTLYLPLLIKDLAKISIVLFSLQSYSHVISFSYLCNKGLWNYDGTHKNGNLFGVESSGKCVSVKGMTLLEVQNCMVKRDSGIVDNLNLLR